jgi:hypothetical protein
MNLSGFLAKTSKLLTDNSPAILSGLAVAGTVATAYLTGRASFKAAEIIAQDEAKGGTAGDLRQRVKERTVLVWKLYIPAAGSAVATIAFIIAANRVGARRAAALAAAYAISERGFQEYRDKIVEKIGERKERGFRDDIAQDRVTRNPPPDDMVLLEDGLSVLCCDLFSGRYFMSDMETLRRAENTVNYRVNNDYYASLTDFYDQIGLPKTSMSDDFGWNSDKLLELVFSTTLTPSGKPCLTFDFKVMPIRGYSRLQ